MRLPYKHVYLCHCVANEKKLVEARPLDDFFLWRGRGPWLNLAGFFSVHLLMYLIIYCSRCYFNSSHCHSTLPLTGTFDRSQSRACRSWQSWVLYSWNRAWKLIHFVCLDTVRVRGVLKKIKSIRVIDPPVYEKFWRVLIREPDKPAKSITDGWHTALRELLCAEAHV